MSIKERLEKIKELDQRLLHDFIVVALIILVGFSAFGLGRLSVEERSAVAPIEVRQETIMNQTAAVPISQEGVETSSSSGVVVGSQNGTKYHFPWCSGAQRMKEENKVWFESIAAARQAGYEPAANCKGLE